MEGVPPGSLSLVRPAALLAAAAESGFLVPVVLPFAISGKRERLEAVISTKSGMHSWGNPDCVEDAPHVILTKSRMHDVILTKSRMHEVILTKSRMHGKFNHHGAVLLRREVNGRRRYRRRP